MYTYHVMYNELKQFWKRYDKKMEYVLGLFVPQCIYFVNKV